MNPRQSGRKGQSWHLESGRTEPLGATVNVQDPPSPPQTAAEEMPTDFQLTCLGSSWEKEGQGCALSCALSSLQAPVAYHGLLVLSNSLLLFYSHLP